VPHEIGRPTDAAEIHPVLIDGRIQLRRHDPGWALAYQGEETKIRSALGGRAILVEHVGSTAVQGLSAKPILDIVLAVEDSTDEASYLPDLEAAGYLFRVREPNWYQHRLFKGPHPAVNLHLFSIGCEEIDRMLDLRNRLRESPQERERYEQAKRALAARTWQTVQDYADAKSDVIAEILGTI